MKYLLAFATVVPLLGQIVPRPVTLPVFLRTDTDIVVKTMVKIDTSLAQEKQVIPATISRPVIQDGREVIPIGENCWLSIVRVEHAGKLKGQNAIELALSEIVLNGTSFPVETVLNKQGAYSRGKDTGKIAAGMAAAGAIAGALFSGGAGWKVGAAAGGGLGVLISSRMPQKKLVLPVETELRFTLKRAADLGGHE